MIPIRFHGYPEPILETSEIMEKLAGGDFVYAQMQNTFEPLLIDVHSKARYAVPEQVDWLIEIITKENRKERYKRMRDEHGI